MTQTLYAHMNKIKIKKKMRHSLQTIKVNIKYFLINCENDGRTEPRPLLKVRTILNSFNFRSLFYYFLLPNGPLDNKLSASFVLPGKY
jgi:hypothetical protein